MKFTPITEKLPQLDRPLLITVLYEGNTEPEITESELYNDPGSSRNPCFNMGSAKNYKVFSWAYILKPKALPSYVEFHERVYNESEQTWDVERTYHF